jgi:CRP-like cAMP-binding protein
LGERQAKLLKTQMNRVLAKDRSAELLLTQEFIANMLGGRRESVTKAARRLQQAGLIQGLEAASCECYQVVKTEFDRLLG